jgi:urease accessory protein
MYAYKWLSALLLLISPSLYAHTGGLTEASLMTGFLHPLTGLDHLLVLMAVGFISVKYQGKPRILLPLLFFSLMITGAVLSQFVTIPFIEKLLAFSVLGFGLLAIIHHQQTAKMLFIALSFFAIFHGYAHAAEIPAAATSAFVYFSALLLMSVSICLAGRVLGLFTGRRAAYLFSLTCLSSGLYLLTAG